MGNPEDEETAKAEAETKVDNRHRSEGDGRPRRRRLVTQSLKDYKQTYLDYSGKASDVTRKAAFAGIALAWVFRPVGQPGRMMLGGLLWPAVLFAIAIACDVFQYVSGTHIWRAFYRYHESRGRPLDFELSHDPRLSRPIDWFFWGKILATIAGYVWLFAFLVMEGLVR